MPQTTDLSNPSLQPPYRTVHPKHLSSFHSHHPSPSHPQSQDPPPNPEQPLRYPTPKFHLKPRPPSPVRAPTNTPLVPTSGFSKDSRTPHCPSTPQKKKPSPSHSPPRIPRGGAKEGGKEDPGYRAAKVPFGSLRCEVLLRQAQPIPAWGRTIARSAGAAEGVQKKAPFTA